MRKNILGGLAIGLGCMGFCSVDNKYIGALLFCIGLVTICSREWGLFTGKLCKINSTADLALTWGLNLVGIAVSTLLYRFSGADCTKAVAVATAKLQKSPLEIILSAILCEICIYIAVIGYGKIEFEIGKYISIILGVVVFILCGFEHSIADMFYAFFMPFSIKTVLFLFLVTVGNIVGAILMRLFDRDDDLDIIFATRQFKI